MPYRTAAPGAVVDTDTPIDTPKVETVAKIDALRLQVCAIADEQRETILSLVKAARRALPLWQRLFGGYAVTVDLLADNSVALWVKATTDTLRIVVDAKALQAATECHYLYGDPLRREIRRTVSEWRRKSNSGVP